MMNEDFETVIAMRELGGKAPVIEERKLSGEAHAAIMGGVNQMGPGIFKNKPEEAQPAAPAATPG